MPTVTVTPSLAPTSAPADIIALSESVLRLDAACEVCGQQGAKYAYIARRDDIMLLLNAIKQRIPQLYELDPHTQPAYPQT